MAIGVRIDCARIIGADTARGAACYINAGQREQSSRNEAWHYADSLKGEALYHAAQSIAVSPRGGVD